MVRRDVCLVSELVVKVREFMWLARVYRAHQAEKNNFTLMIFDTWPSWVRLNWKESLHCLMIFDTQPHRPRREEGQAVGMT